MAKKSLNEFMAMRKEVSRWLIAKVFIVGVFCGASLGVVYMWLAFVVQ